jgi:predicted RNA-binding protein with PUA-like domain
MKKYWLMKSEPDVFSIDDLKRDQSTPWEGVRNYQARNFMMNEMQVGDEVLFYHSNAEPPGIAGLAVVAKPPHPDQTAFNKKSPYFEPKATAEKPIWHCVDVAFKEKFKKYVSLEELRQREDLSDILVVKKGQRLSIQPVSPEHFEIIKQLGKSK